MKKTGILITFEGGEGGGKTTQVAALLERLHATGRAVLSLREPGGTAISEQIREVVLSAKNQGITDATEVLLFQAARAQIYREVVLPALDAGTVVLMDRSRDSSVVYQGIVRGFGKDLIDQLNNFSTNETYPDLTILLDLPVENGLQRKVDQEEMNRFELVNKSFHEQVREAYLQLANADTTGRWKIVDATQKVEIVEEEIWRLIQEKLQ